MEAIRYYEDIGGANRRRNEKLFFTVPVTAEKVRLGISIESKHRKMKMMDVTQ